MRGSFKILFILLFSYPVYLIAHNILINGLNLLAGGTAFFYSIGVVCTVEQNFSTIAYYSVILLIQLALFLSVRFFKIHLSNNIFIHWFGAFLIILFSFEVLNFIAYAIDFQFDTFYRSFFIVSSHIYALSLALNLPVLLIPLFFLSIIFLLLYPLLKIKKTIDVVISLVLPFFSVLLYHLLFNNIFLKA